MVDGGKTKVGYIPHDLKRQFIVNNIDPWNMGGWGHVRGSVFESHLFLMMIPYCDIIVTEGDENNR